MAEIINGRELAKELRQSIDLHIDELIKEHGILPGLAVVIVGEDPASLLYIENKKRAAAKVGIKSFVHQLPEESEEDKILNLIDMLNDDDNVNGILVQLPLPEHIDPVVILEAINPDKDVDGLHSYNVGSLVKGNSNSMAPCTPLGCMALIKKVEHNLSGLHAVVIGRSNLVGRPMAELLLKEDCTVTICHSKTADIAEISRQADILISATGEAGLVKKEWIKPDAIVIDVGITRVEKGKLAGDVLFDEVSEVAKYITTVPGGVGPMTIACLLGNTLIATCRQNGLTVPQIG